jgi:hypothetical protein
MDMIRDAARELAMQAPGLVRQNPYFALGALSLAVANIAVICKVKYTDLLTVLQAHYEHALLEEVEAELKAAGDADVMVQKPQGEQ